VKRSEKPAAMWSLDDRTTAVVAGVLLVLLYVSSLLSYLLFHTLAEIVFIVVCLSVVVLAWSLRPFLDDDFAIVLGVALAFVAGLHILHIMDYPGLGLISGSPDPPTQLWLGARLLLVAALIASAFVIGRRVKLWIVGACCAGYTAVLVASIYWWQLFPVTLTEATGLTPFKKGAEYVLCALFAVAIVLLWRKSDRLPGQTWRLLRAGLVVTIAAELWFTLYQSAHTWPNLVGHFLLVLSALLIFRAVVDDGLARPHVLAVSNLREAEQMHRRLEQALVPSVPVRREGLDILTHYRPSEHHLALSGDFIDVLDRGQRGVAIICGDVSGHGPNAAAMGAMLRASWQALTDSGAGAETIVRGLSALLERERKNPTTFATLCLAWIDPRMGKVTILNLGHPSPLLVLPDGGVSRLSMIPMPPLGTVDWPVEQPMTAALPEGWRLLFYTDGLLEGRASPGSTERFGERRLIDAVRRHVTGPVGKDDLDRFIREVEAAGGAPFDDDVAVLLVSAAGASATVRDADGAPEGVLARAAG
jgi:hypothetical protein